MHPNSETATQFTPWYAEPVAKAAVQRVVFDLRSSNELAVLQNDQSALDVAEIAYTPSIWGDVGHRYLHPSFAVAQAAYDAWWKRYCDEPGVNQFDRATPKPFELCEALIGGSISRVNNGPIQFKPYSGDIFGRVSELAAEIGTEKMRIAA